LACWEERCDIPRGGEGVQVMIGRVMGGASPVQGIGQGIRSDGSNSNWAVYCGWDGVVGGELEVWEVD